MSAAAKLPFFNRIPNVVTIGAILNRRPTQTER
jgi:hypothetical protein